MLAYATLYLVSVFVSACLSVLTEFSLGNKTTRGQFIGIMLWAVAPVFNCVLAGVSAAVLLHTRRNKPEV